MLAPWLYQDVADAAAGSWKSEGTKRWAGSRMGWQSPFPFVASKLDLESTTWSMHGRWDHMNNTSY